MAGLKEIRRRITSIRNTRQITRAMKLVSAAKLKRAEEAALAGKTFTERLEVALAAVLVGLPRNFSHPFIRSTEERKGERRIIAIAGERGLCGAYNSNVVKALLSQDIETSPRVEVVPIGRRMVSAAKRFVWNSVKTFEGLPDDIRRWPIDALTEELFADFRSGKVGEIVIYYTRFISGLNQKVVRETLLPFNTELLSVNISPAERAHLQKGQFEYSASPEQLFDLLAPLYVKAKIKTAILQSKASEHASRMAAMDSATNNADELIAKLRLFYNRARQSAITKELLDIIGGAEALE